MTLIEVFWCIIENDKHQNVSEALPFREIVKLSVRIYEKKNEKDGAKLEKK